MKKKKLWTQKWEDKLVKDAEAYANKITKDAEARAKPKPEDIFKWMYHDTTPDLQEQLKYLKEVISEKPKAGETNG